MLQVSEVKQKAKAVGRKAVWSAYGATHPVIGYALFAAAHEYIGHSTVVIVVALFVYGCGIVLGVWHMDGEAVAEYQTRVFDRAFGKDENGVPTVPHDVQ